MSTHEAKSFMRVVEVLTSHGWQFIRASDSHYNYHKPGKIMIVTVPYHGRNTLIKVGTLKSIARQAGISEEEF